MKIVDIFRLNDWNLRSFLILVLSILLAYNSVCIVNKFFFAVPFLTPFLGFIVLTFFPGFLILRVLRIYQINRTINVLLAAGLSISFLMLTGLFINLVYPLFNIQNPISFPFLLGTYNIIFFILIITCYLKDKDFKIETHNMDLEIFSKFHSFLIFPILAVIGTYVMNYYNSNVLIIILLFLVALTPIVVAFDKIPEKYYPFLIFTISISILYQMSLISTYIWGYDVFYQVYGSNLIIENSIWNLQSDKVIPILLITILVPSYSILCDLNTIYVYKLLLPFIFSLTPLVLYKLFQKLYFQFDSKLALFSTFLFIFYYGFFKDMSDKQHIAELFLSLILLLMLLDISHKALLILVFSFSLITTHYGLSYLFMLSLIAVLLIPLPILNTKNRLISSNYVTLFFVLALSWYIFFTSSNLLVNIVDIANHMLSNLTELIQPDERSGLNYAFKQSESLLWLAYKLIHILLQLLIGLGVLSLILSLLKKQVRYFEISLLTVVFYTFLVIQVFKTYGMGFDRIFQITLLLLAPLSILGLISFNAQASSLKNWLFCLMNLKQQQKVDYVSSYVDDIETNVKKYLQIRIMFGLFLMIFFLFNSGVIFSIADDTVPSYGISLDKNSGWPLYEQSEISGILWLKNYKADYRVAVFNEGSSIKSRDGLLAVGSIKELTPVGLNTSNNMEATYIFMGNPLKSNIFIENPNINIDETIFYSFVLSKSNMVYNSGKSSIYYS